MFRFAGIGLVGLLAIGVWIYCIFDVIAAEDVLVRNLPKGVWLIIVLLFATIGSIAWLALGRPLYAGWRPGDTGGSSTRRVVGPEDRADYAPPRPTQPLRRGPPAGLGGRPGPSGGGGRRRDDPPRD